MRSAAARKASIGSAWERVALLAAGSSAQAAIGFGPGLSAQPADDQAGANSNFTINMPFTGSGPDDSVRDLRVGLPPGLIGNPTAAPLCTVEQFQAGATGSCPPASQVGEVSVSAALNLLSPLNIPVDLPTPITGSIYNMQPQPGEPARFGIVLSSLPFTVPLLGDFVLPPIKQQSGVELRDDLGLDTVLNDIPNTAEVIRIGQLPVDAEIRITSQTLTLSGEIAGKGFMRNPTSCKQHAVGFDATDPTGDTATAQATFTTTGCDKLAFDPKLSATIGSPGRTDPATKPPLTATIRQNADEAGLKRAAVILPEGVTADSATLGNRCSTAQFRASACPPSTVIGSAIAETPLLTSPLSGQVSIVEPLQAGALPNLGVDLKGPLPLQLRGNFVLTPGPGNVFEGLPDTPITRFALGFDPEKLILTTRDLCQAPPPLLHAEFEGHNGRKLSKDVAAGVDGCGADAAAPTAKVKLRRSKSRRPRMKATVKAGVSGLRRMNLKLPKQLRLAKGNRFKRGAKASAGRLRGGRRKLRLKSDQGVVHFKVRVAKRALKRVKPIKKGKRLRFPIKATDVTGKTTKLKPRARAR